MKAKQLVTLILSLLLAINLVAPVWAQQPGKIAETRNLFKSPGRKQTAKDFKPAPDEMKTNFGTLKFEGGAFPTDDSVQKIYNELDLQRATQAYMDFFPALSLYGIVKSQIRDFGFKTSSDVGVMADFMHPSENYLTGNDVTVYAFASLDLKVDGPTVVEIPPGMYGNANDAAFKYLTDFGPTGPDKGKGGKYLFVPPGYKGKIPDGYHVFKSPGYRIWAMMRGFGEVGNGDQAVRWFQERLKVYPLASGPRTHKAINTSKMGANTLPPEDGSVFTMLNEIIQYEPTELFSPELLGRLATLGIEKGKPFNPDKRMQGIFDQAAKQGVAMSRAIVYASRDPEINYWPNRHWEKMFVRNTEFTKDGDSAGGGLATSTVPNLRDRGMGVPAAVVLLSPWADISDNGDTMHTLENTDPTLHYDPLLKTSAIAYADGLDLTDPRVSPLYGDFSKGFSPPLIAEGTKCIFLSTSVRLFQALEAADQKTTLDVYEGMWHVFQTSPIPETEVLLKKISVFLLKHLAK